jgi:O-antigen ligase
MKKLQYITVSDNIFVYGISSIPFFLILGPAIPDIVISLLILFFLFTKIAFVIEAIKKYYYLFLVWSLYLVFNSLISDNIFFSLSSSLPYIRFSFLLILIYYLIEYCPRFLNLCIYCLSFSILLISFDSLFQYFIGVNLIGNIYDGHRLTSFFGDEKKMGYYTYVFSSILLSLFFLKNKLNFKTKIFIFIILFLTIFLIVVSGERNTLLKFCVMSFLLLFLLEIDLRTKIFFIFSTIFFIFFLFLTNNNIYYRFFRYTIEESFNVDKFLIINEKYNNIFLTAFFIFKNNPFFGVGPKMFREVCQYKIYFINGDLQGCSTHPHNIYLQLLSETGIIGITPFLLVILMIIRKLIILKKYYSINSLHYNGIVILTCLILSNLFPFSTYGNFFNNWISITLFFPSGFLMYYLFIKQYEKK